MIYVLIVIAQMGGYVSGISSVTFQEFTSMESCMTAKKTIDDSADRSAKTRCVEK